MKRFDMRILNCRATDSALHYAMDERTRMLNAMMHLPVDRLPWVPRLDLWYIAQTARGTMEERFRGLNMVELATALGVGCHAVRGDFTLERKPGDLSLRGLGFDNHPDYPFRVELTRLPVEHSQDGPVHTTRIKTSKGDLTFALRHTSEMAAAGISLPFVLSYPVEHPEDLDRAALVFENLDVIPTPDGYDAFRERVGASGVAVANGCVAASPVHLLLHELMPMDLFFYLYHDDRGRIDEFSERLRPFFAAMLEAVVQSSAEVILWGANFDRDLTWPPFFRKEIIPWLQDVSSRFHDHGKLLLCHTDGENEELTDLYRASKIDVVESFCPAPMTSMSLSDFRERLGGEMCVWGGIPSVALLGDSFDARSFEQLVAQLEIEKSRSIDICSPLVLGVSDNVPPDAELDRLRRITELCTS